MLISFYKIFFVLLVIALVYSNLSAPLSHPVIVSIYPYLLVLTVLFLVFLIITQIFQDLIIIKIMSVIMTVFFLFFIFTFFRICQNIKTLNNNKIQTESSAIDTTTYNKVLQIYDGSVMLDEIIEEIMKAKQHIHIEFYIFRNHDITEKFKSILIEKAKEGVEVKVIYDGLGSFILKRSYIKDLKGVGVEIKAYDNIFKSIVEGKLNHRNHKKLVIVDGKVGFTGGINMGDEYLGRDKSVGSWNDALVKIKGEAVNSMQKVFLDDWRYITGEKLSNNKYFPKTEVENHLPIQIVSSRYNPYGNEINKLYYSTITSAKEELYIVTPYISLSDGMMNALNQAVLRGINVKIVLPQNTNHIFASWVNQTFYKELLDNNIKIYLHKDGFLHSKIFIADRQVVSIGSANFDSRAQYLDYEINAVLFDEYQGNQAVDQINKYMDFSQSYTLEDYNNRSLSQKITEKIGILLRPIV